MPETEIALPVNETRPETIAETLGPRPGEHPILARLAWGMAAIAAAFVLVALASPLIPRSPAFRARQIVRLPPDAKVTEVDAQSGSRFGDVYFTVPESKGPGTRLREIWTSAGLPLPRVGPAMPALARATPLKRTPPTTTARGSGTGTSLRGGAHMLARPMFAPPSAFGPRHLPNGYDYSDGAERTVLHFQRLTGTYHFQRMQLPHQDAE